MTQQLQHRIALGLFAAFSLVFSVNLFLLQPLERSAAFKRMGTPGPGVGLETAATGGQAPLPQASSSETAAATVVPSTDPDVAPSAAVIAAAPATQATEPAVSPVAVPQVDPSLLAVTVRELADRGAVTGAAGNPMDMVTRAAIMAAEWDNNLPLTGLPSEALLQRIIMGAPGGAPKDTGSKAEPGEAARDVIRTVQQSLQMLGAGGVKPDGLMGAATARAIRNFEARYKMPQTGRISGALVKRLGEIAGEGKLSDRG